MLSSEDVGPWAMLMGVQIAVLGVGFVVAAEIVDLLQEWHIEASPVVAVLNEFASDVLADGEGRELFHDPNEPRIGQPARPELFLINCNVLVVVGAGVVLHEDLGPILGGCGESVGKEHSLPAEEARGSHLIEEPRVHDTIRGFSDEELLLLQNIVVVPRVERARVARELHPIVIAEIVEFIDPRHATPDEPGIVPHIDIA